MSAISPAEFEAIRARVEVNKRRGIAALAVAASVGVTPAIPSRAEVKLEVRDLHIPFKQWLGLKGLRYWYQNPTKKSNGPPGFPDFAIFQGDRYCLIEFKTESSRLSDDQVKWHEAAAATGVGVLVARSFDDARCYTMKRLCLTV